MESGVGVLERLGGFRTSNRRESDYPLVLQNVSHVDDFQPTAFDIAHTHSKSNFARVLRPDIPPVCIDSGVISYSAHLTERSTARGPHPTNMLDM